jgi:hypothetical protein
MRAETVNFERNNNPRAMLGVGGINFNKKFNDLFEESMKSLEGKTITARMIRHWTERGGISKESRNSMQTIKATNIDAPHLESFGGFNYRWKIYLDDDKGNRYSMSLDQPIYIES